MLEILFTRQTLKGGPITPAEIVDAYIILTELYMK